MKFYRYWVRIEVPINFDDDRKAVICGKSNLSKADALEDAENTVKTIRKRIAQNAPYQKPDDYEVPIKEELLEELAPGNIITRNYYGAEILNTETLIFADIDNTCFPKRYIPGFIGRLFGKKEETKAAYQDRIKAAVFNSIKSEWIRESHIRIYKTHSGYRVLIAGLNIKPGSAECSAILNGMNSDKLYSVLCRKQECCRARLTPKPHRLKLSKFRFKYPYSPNVMGDISFWIQKYQKKSEEFSVCRLLKTFGKEPDEKDLQIIRYHDEKCKVSEQFPLA